MVAISTTVDQHLATPLCHLSEWFVEKHQITTHFLEEKVRDYTTQQVADYANYAFKALPYCLFFVWASPHLVLGTTCVALWLKLVKPTWLQDPLGTDVGSALLYSQIFMTIWRLIQCIWNPATSLLIETGIHALTAKLCYDAVYP